MAGTGFACMARFVCAVVSPWRGIACAGGEQLSFLKGRVLSKVVFLLVVGGIGQG